MTRRERIEVLLDYYRDVEDGFADRSQHDEKIIGMCRAWNHPSYETLRKLLKSLQLFDEKISKNLALRYTRWSESRQYAWCKGRRKSGEVCGRHDSALTGKQHRHGRDVFKLVGRTEWALRPHDPVLVELGIDWLEENWPGSPDTEPRIPGDVMQNVTQRRLRSVA